MVEENICMRRRWLHTSGDLVLIAKFGTYHIFWKDLLEAGQSQSAEEKISLYIAT